MSRSRDAPLRIVCDWPWLLPVPVPLLDTSGHLRLAVPGIPTWRMPQVGDGPCLGRDISICDNEHQLV